MSCAVEMPPFVSDRPDAPPVVAVGVEFDLLVACCAAFSGGGEAERIGRVLSRSLDWERLLELVDQHRVVPQVYGQLSAMGDLVPERIRCALQRRYQDNARKALWFTGELVRVVSHFESRGIEVLPYKGPGLAQVLYGDVAQRQFGDLDVIVRAQDVIRAKAALLELGYKAGVELVKDQEHPHIDIGYECPFYSAGGSLLELQWRILPRFYTVDFDVTVFFERAEGFIVGGRVMRTLRAEDLLLVLCVHAAKHVWGQLSWLCDIGLLVRSRQLDWHAIQEEARRLGIERIVGVNLLLAHRLFGVALPAPTQNRLLENSGVSRLADEILCNLERGRPYDTESMSYFGLMMRLRERWTDRARFVWRLAFTPGPGEWSVVQLPKSAQPLYHVVRLLRLAKRMWVGHIPGVRSRLPRICD